MKNIKLTILGVATLLFALTLNFRHALNDYGVMDNKLHMEVLAQSNTSSDGDGSNKNKVDCREVNCVGTWVGTADVDGCITVFKKRICNFGARVKVTYNYSGKKENCTGGSSFYDCNACQVDCVGSTT